MSFLGIAGEPNASKLTAVGIAGVNTSSITSSALRASSAVGIAGNHPPERRQALHLLGGGCDNDDRSLGDRAQRQALHLLGGGCDNDDRSLGDRAQRQAWKAGVWFVDYTYILSPFADRTGMMGWRAGRELIFSRPYRTLPLFLDSTGFRRMTGTAPRWAQSLDRYVEAIDVADPDAYMSWDFPNDRAASLAGQQSLEAHYGDDARMWPVWSVRWSWDDNPPFRLHDLPGWGRTALRQLIPITPNQTTPGPEVLEQWARLAVANAVLTARDPDFQRLASCAQKIAIGGMVKGPCPRIVRHLYMLALDALMPGRQWWMLGQANYATANGIAMVGLLDRVSCDGSWYIADALCHKVAFVERGLINTINLGGEGRESFLTTGERMASLLRSLLALWSGMITWPAAPKLPIDFRDLGQLGELKRSYQGAQMELGLYDTPAAHCL